MPQKMHGSRSTDSGSGLSSPKLWPTLPMQGAETGTASKSVDHNTPSSVAMVYSGEDVDDSKSQHSLSA